MLALLLFLVCALAGAAAVTAAGSNVGRYSYVEEDRQQFLTVTSAAKLIRDELNGLSVTGEYTYEIKDDEIDVLHTDVNNHTLIITPETDPTVKITYNGKDDPEGMMEFFAKTLEKFNKNVFLNDNKKADVGFNGKDYLWKEERLQKIKNEAGTISTESFNLIVSCDNFEDVTVEITIKEGDYKDVNNSSAKEIGSVNVKIISKNKKMVYEMSGDVIVDELNHEYPRIENVTRPCKEGERTIAGTPIEVTEIVVLKSIQTTTIKLDFDDAVIVRQKNTEPEGE